MPYRDLEPAVARIGRELQAHVRQRRSRRDRAEQRLLDLVVAEPAARARLFQLVDAFPALRGSEDVSDHIAGYLDDEGVPAAMRLAVRASRRVPGGDRVSAAVARRGITHMASRFIAGTDAAAARPTFERIWAAGMGVIVDLLGEKTITQPDADRYAARAVAGLIERPAAPRSGEGRRSIAIKPTALAPRLTRSRPSAGLAEARERLRADPAGGDRPRTLLVWFDMEHYDVKDLTLHPVPLDLLGEPELAAARAGIVIQAYLRDSARDLADLIGWSRGAPPADHRAAGEGRLLGRRDGAWPGPTAGRCRSSSTRTRPTPTTSAACACSTTTTADGRAPRSARTTSARSPTPSPYADDARHPRHRLRAADALRHGRAGLHAAVRRSACASACTRRSASSCRAWPTSCGGC